MAYSTLRTNRSRPIRLIGEPENRAAKPRIVQRASSASRGARRSSRAA
jgi:hypothetical protein